MTADARRQVIETAATAVFAERGYRGGSIEEIARRSGVTPPVVYDHFTSKQELYEKLVDHHYGELRAIWFAHGPASGPVRERMPEAIAAWFGYLEDNPFAAPLLFRDPTGDPHIGAAHRKIQKQSRATLLPLATSQAITGHPEALAEDQAVEMAWEALRGALQSLALWWTDHPDMPRDRVVATALDAVWIGLDRVLAGEAWPREGDR